MSDTAQPPPGPAEQEPDDQIAGALERLGPLDEMPVDEHVAVYDEVHRDLHAALTDPPAGESPDAP